MSKFGLPLLGTRESIRNTPYEEMGELFRRHDGELILVTHDMTTGEYLSRQRYLQLGVISSRDYAVTFSTTHVYLPTTRFVWSLDNRGIKYERGEIILPITEGQQYAFLEVPRGTDYFRTLFIGTTEVEKWLVKQNKLPYLRGDLFRALDYPMGEGENFSLDPCFV